MQHSPYEVKDKLLRALDKEYNVVDMATVLEVISLLEKAIITRETLEKTRIGKYINELRKRTSNEQLARRAKELVKSWRRLIPQNENPINGERVISNTGTSVLGPGPAFGPSNRLLKPHVSAPVSPSYKMTSPSTLCERSPSPFCSSASNSPQFTMTKLQGSNKSPASSSYAPSKSSQAGIHMETNKSQNKSHVCSQIFKPVSPALAAIRHANSNIGPVNVVDIPHPKPQNRSISPAHLNSSRSCSPRIESSALNAANDSFGGQRNCHKVISPGIPFSTPVSSGSAHSSLEIAKTNVANKRLRKDTSIISKMKRTKSVINDSCDYAVQNGIDSVPELSEKLLPSESSAFKILSSLNQEEKKAHLKLDKQKKTDIHSSDLLREKFLSLYSGTKLTKVKTTQQLIEELQARKDALSNTTSKFRDVEVGAVSSKKSSDKSVSSSELLGSKFEPIDQRLSSSPESPSNSAHQSPMTDRLSSPLSDNVPSKSSVISPDKDFGVPFTDPVSVEIEQLLSTLPPVNPEDANMTGYDYEPPLPERTITEADVERYSENLEHVNGNYSADGTWRPWLDCTEIDISEGEKFRILPYVNID